MTPKKSNKAPITDPEEMEIYKLSEKELIFFWEVIIFFVIILAVSIAVYNLF